MSGYRVWGIWRCRACEGQREFITYDLSSIDADMAECCVCGFQYGKRIDMTEEDPSKRVKANVTKATIARGRARYVAQQTGLSRLHGTLAVERITPQILHELRRREGEE
jgi:hypothetical protein